MASNSKKRRRVLGASCILAALIIASSSFAWFTSSDEVTNRLSASADYGVTIAENFQPPENWIPGQTINKDVGVVNTGNVDAFTRVWLTGEMKVLNTTALGDTNKTVYANFGDVVDDTKTANTTDAKLKALNLNRYKDVSDERYYYKELDVAQTDNPENNGESNQKNGYQYDGVRGTDTPGSGTAPSTPNSTAYSEVQTIQAGGYLVSAPAKAEYEYVTNQETELKVLVKKGSAQVEETLTVPGGTLVKVIDTTKTGMDSKYSADVSATGEVTNLCNGTYKDKSVRGTSDVPVVYVKAQDSFKPVVVDAETFAPVTTGTYIFARNADLQSDNGAVKVEYDTLDDYEFAGYYFDAFADNAKAWAGKGTYWALKNADARGTNRSDYTLPKNYDIKINGAAAASPKDKKIDTGYAGDYDTTVLTLDFDNSGYLSSVTPTANLEMYNANYKVVETDGLDWSYDSTNKVLSAIYQGTAKLESTDDDAAKRTAKLRDDIVVDIQLANIGTDSEQWTAVEDTSINTTMKYYAKPADGKEYTLTTAPTDVNINRLWTFYYNNDVEEGDTTAKLVDSVTLRHTTQKDAFIAFDFDLNVNMESAQVTMDEDGKEQATAVTSWVATKDSSNNNVNTTAKPGATMSYDGTEISDVDWVYSAT